MQHRIILKYKESRDGILAWDEFKQNFEYDGSKELRLEQLEALAQKPYNNSVPGGMAAYIDQFQAYMAELGVIAPIGYSDFRMKRRLLANIRHADGVSHLVQTCRDNEHMTYEQCVAYLRKNAIYIDHANAAKTPSRLMHVQDSPQLPESSDKSVDEVTQLFLSMAKEDGLDSTYRMFNTKTF
jgi:hypothetical protein